MSLDIYEGWIVALVYGLWRNCRVAAGFAAVANQHEPNKHKGIFATPSIGNGTFTGEELTTTRYLLVGPMVLLPAARRQR